MSKKYYCLCDCNNRYETMTKEQIYTAITQAVESGEIHDVDTGFVTTIVTIDNKTLKFFYGLQSEYDALSEEQKTGLFAIITNDTSLDDINAAIEGLKDGTVHIGYAERAGTADNATHADEADYATDAGLAENADWADVATHAMSAEWATNSEHAETAKTLDLGAWITYAGQSLEVGGTYQVKCQPNTNGERFTCLVYIDDNPTSAALGMEWQRESGSTGGRYAQMYAIKANASHVLSLGEIAFVAGLSGGNVEMIVSSLQMPSDTKYRRIS